MRINTCVVVALALTTAGCDGDSRSSQAAATTTPAATPSRDEVAMAGRVTFEGDPDPEAVLIVSSQETGLAPHGLDPASMFTSPQGEFALLVPPDTYDVVVVGSRRPNSTLRTTVDLRHGPQEGLSFEVTEDQAAVQDLIQTGGAE